MNNYTPNPIDTSNVQLPRELNTLMENLAKNNHDIWALQKFSEGWHYGEIRDETQQIAPNLIEYEKLPESAKEFDKNTARETLKSIYKLGFLITKQTKGQVLCVGKYTQKDVDALTLAAKSKGLQLVSYSDWETAKSVFERDLTKWSAIILDSKAKLVDEGEPTSVFLRDVLDDLNVIYSQNRNEVPWFILPSFYDTETDAVIRYTVGRDRYNKDWGKVLYKSPSENDSLFQNITDLLPKTKNYRIQSVYDEVFDILDTMFPEEVKNMLFNTLMPLHYPEAFHSFVPTDYYNNLRRVIESFFAVSCKYGLLPDDVCYSHENNGSVNLRNSSDYFKNGRGSDICPPSIGTIISNVLDITNEGSHMGSEYKTQGQFYSIMGFSLQLCDVILWFGRYVKEHNCISVEDAIKLYENKEVIVEIDESGNYFSGKCVFLKSYIESNNLLGCKVRLFDVAINTSASRKYYPLFAKTKKQ